MFSSTTHRPGSRRPGAAASRNVSVTINPSPPRTPQFPLGGPLSHSNSRYATPQGRFGRGSPLASEGVHATSSNVKLYANRPELTVSFASSLPKELSTVLSKSDFQAEAYSGAIDPETHHAYIASPTTCFVWDTSSTPALYPTCYLFPLPPIQSNSDSLLAPQACLIPYVGPREPGLIVGSGRGVFRFWESIGSGLSGGDNFHSLDLGYASGEYLTKLARLQVHQTYVALSTRGRVTRISVTDVSGRPGLSSTDFGSASTGTLSRFITLFGAPAGITPSGEAALGVASTREEVYVLTEKHVQVWSGSGEELRAEVDLPPKIEAFSRQEPIDAFGGRDIELHDIAIRSDEDLVVLISHPSKDGRNTLDYSAARIEMTSDVAFVKSIKPICFDVPRDPRPGTSPKMILLDGGSALMLLFGGLIAIASLSDRATFRQSLNLRTAWNRTLGFGMRGDELGVMVASNGVLSFRMDHERIKDFHADTPTNQLKATMEQAIFYGAMAENPFEFTLSPHAEGNLDLAASSLSKEILTSQSPLLHSTLDMKTQLTDRVQLLRAFMLFLNNNLVAGQLSVSGRKLLSVDAERLTVALDLWTLINGDPGCRDILTRGIESYLQQVGTTWTEDSLRYFFKTKLDSLEYVFGEIFNFTETRSGRKSLQHANKILLCAYFAIIRHREATQRLYNLDQTAARVPTWTNSSEMLRMTADLEDGTAVLLQDMKKDGRRASEDLARAHAEAREQLKNLAAMTFWVFGERIGLLTSVAEETKDKTELKNEEDRFTSIRKTIVDHLLLFSLANVAFELAITSRDYRLLAKLCVDPQAWVDRGDDPEKVAEGFIQTYGNPFAFQLYHLYTENGQAQKLLTQSQRHTESISLFFEQQPDPKISWLHYLTTHDMAKAADALWMKADREKMVSERKLSLSIQKLCEVAQLNNWPDSADQLPPGISACNRALDVISIHEELRREFEAIVQHEADQHTTLEQSLMDRVQIVVESADLSWRSTSLPSLFRGLTRLILHGEVLEPEDLVDTLTLKYNTGHARNGFPDAAYVWNRAMHSQAVRQESTLHTIWRRAYTCDDWSTLHHTAGLTDEQIEDRLRQTALFGFIRYLEDQTPGNQIPMVSVVDAHNIPDEGEIQARFPQFSQEQVAGLHDDYLRERERLERIREEYDFDETLEYIQRLARTDEVEEIKMET